MKHIALSLVSAAVLALPVGAVHAEQSGAKKPAATKKAPAKKPARKAPAKTVKAVEANTPVQTPTDRLTDAEMEIAKRVHTGKVQCELGADVTVAADEKNPGFFHVSTGKQRFFMHPVESRTGAIRLEDIRTGAMLLQLGNKSMLMNQKLGQRIADECQSTEQRAFAEQMKNSGGPGLLDSAPQR